MTPKPPRSIRAAVLLLGVLGWAGLVFAVMLVPSLVFVHWALAPWLTSMTICVCSFILRHGIVNSRIWSRWSTIVIGSAASVSLVVGCANMILERADVPSFIMPVGLLGICLSTVVALLHRQS